MNVIIHPYEGIEIEKKGRIHLGMTREEVRSFFKEKPEEFMKTPDSETVTDAFDNIGIHAYFKQSNELEALEIFPEAKPSLEGRLILDIFYHDLLEWFEIVDSKVDLSDEDGLTSYKYGLAFYAPGASEEDSNYKAESVLIFERGYYDS